jgi:primase-polymerase (primpol)-like protein
LGGRKHSAVGRAVRRKRKRKSMSETSKPTPPPVNAEAIPAELKAVPHWVVWGYELRNGRWAKPPISCRTGNRTDVTSPDVRVSFGEALEYQQKRRLDGVGFVFTDETPYSGIDLDDCRDPASGRLTEEAQAIIRELSSYTEVSPSGTGVKIFIRGKLPADSSTRKGGIEMYSIGRYFTVTGMHLEGTPTTIEDRQDALLRLYERVFGEKESKPKQKRIEPQADEPSEQAGPQDPTDAEIIARAMRAENGEKFARLWAGGTGISTALTGQTDFQRESMQTRGTKITRFNRTQQEQTGTVDTGRERGGYL